MMDLTTTSGVAFGWHLHAVFGGILFLAAVFLVIWAAKHMKKDELKRWTTWLLAIGIIGTLLTGHLGFRGWDKMMKHHTKCVELTETTE